MINTFIDKLWLHDSCTHCGALSSRQERSTTIIHGTRFCHALCLLAYTSYISCQTVQMCVLPKKRFWRRKYKSFLCRAYLRLKFSIISCALSQGNPYKERQKAFPCFVCALGQLGPFWSFVRCGILSLSRFISRNMQQCIQLHDTIRWISHKFSVSSLILGVRRVCLPVVVHDDLVKFYNMKSLETAK